jgi:hypothetical protein
MSRGVASEPVGRTHDRGVLGHSLGITHQGLQHFSIPYMSLRYSAVGLGFICRVGINWFCIANEWLVEQDAVALNLVECPSTHQPWPPAERMRW